MTHEEPFDRAGKTVKLNIKIPESDPSTGVLTEELRDQEYEVKDYWDRLSSGSWMDAEGNPAALKYALRSGIAGLPMDDEVVYGHVGGLGHIVHVSELGDVVEV